MKMRAFGSFFVLGLALGGCSVAPAEEASGASEAAARVERTYAMVFGTQDPLNRARLSHTYTTWVRAQRAEDGSLEVVEQQDISWLPSTFDGEVCVLGCRPERGRNYTLEETLAFAESSPRRLRVAVWGPYEVPRSLYDAARAEAAWLASGNVAYIAEDARWRAPALAMTPGGAYNCIHASGGFIPTPWDRREPEFRRSGLEWGFRASGAVAEALGGNMVATTPLADARALFAATGVSGRGIEWRTAPR